jgi:hypothetical protein
LIEIGIYRREVKNDVINGKYQANSTSRAFEDDNIKLRKNTMKLRYYIQMEDSFQITISTNLIIRNIKLILLKWNLDVRMMHPARYKDKFGPPYDEDKMNWIKKNAEKYYVYFSEWLKDACKERNGSGQII